MPSATTPWRARLDKALAAAGLGSRKDVRQLIRQGRVSVNGEAVIDPGSHLPMGAVVEVDGAPVQLGPLVIMLNKPAGVVTAARDARHRTVLDLFPPALRRRLFPVGRLDRDTEGLLLLTNDGALCHRLIAPRHGVEKEYAVRVEGALSTDLPAAFAAGVPLGAGEVARPARLEIEAHGPPGEARVILTEGKYHQVKRMFAAFGLHVIGLRRTRIGGVRLDEQLAPGAYRPLDDGELARLEQPASLEPPMALRPPAGGD